MAVFCLSECFYFKSTKIKRLYLNIKEEKIDKRKGLKAIK